MSFLKFSWQTGEGTGGAAGEGTGDVAGDVGQLLISCSISISVVKYYLTTEGVPIWSV